MSGSLYVQHNYEHMLSCKTLNLFESLLFICCGLLLWVIYTLADSHMSTYKHR